MRSRFRAATCGNLNSSRLQGRPALLRRFCTRVKWYCVLPSLGRTGPSGRTAEFRLAMPGEVAELGIFGTFVAEGGEVRCNKVGRLANWRTCWICCNLQFCFWQIGAYLCLGSRDQRLFAPKFCFSHYGRPGMHTRLLDIFSDQKGSRRIRAVSSLAMLEAQLFDEKNEKHVTFCWIVSTHADPRPL